MAESLGVVLLGGGALLVYAALTDQNPVVELRKALSSGTIDGPPATRAPLGIGADTLAPPSGAPSVTPGGGALTAIGQGSHRLAPDAAGAFMRWQAAYGAPIKVTDSYRDPAAQAAGYAADPTRFAKPGTSAHEVGRAVDVNLPALGITPTGPPNQWRANPKYARLLDAANATGWCNYQVARGSTGGKMAEPWHFSYGGCS